MSTRAAGPLGSRAASSVAWLTGQTWLVKAGGFVTVIILARLLTPTDFGMVAVAMTVVPVVSLIADLGFGTYLMQTPALTPLAASTAFWYSAASGFVLAGVLVATAPLLEALFGVPGVAAVIAAMSPAVVFASLAAVPIALLRRELRFRALSIQTAVAAITAQVVAIVLALLGAGVWALVVQISVLQGVTLVAAWVAARWRPRFRFALPALRTMMAFGTKVVGVNLIATARQWAENAIISNVLGAGALGQLSISQRLVQTSQEVGGAAIAPVSTVVFAQVREDPARTRRGYDRALGLSYVVIAPSLTFILVTAPVLVPFLFGPQWSASIVAAQALALAAMFTLAATLDHGLCYGLGRPGAWLAYAVGIDALTIGVTALTASHGIDAVALGFVAVAAVATVIRCVMVSKLLGSSVWPIARRILAAFMVMAGSAGAGWGALSLVGAWPPIAALAVAGTVVLAAHLALSSVLMRAAVRDLVREARSRISRRVAS